LFEVHAPMSEYSVIGASPFSEILRCMIFYDILLKGGDGGGDGLVVRSLSMLTPW